MSKRISVDELPREMKALQKRLKKAAEAGIRKTSRDAVRIIEPRVPKAFGDLRDSMHADEGGGAENLIARTVISAPHASAVEQGARPFYPNYEAILKWVKLRGMQGLTGKGKLRKRFSKSEGPTTPEHASRVASQMRAQEVRGSSKRGRSAPVEAPEAIARAICNAISKSGIKPTWMVRNSLPEIEAKLGANVQSALARVKE